MSKKVQERRLKWCGTCHEKGGRLCGEKSNEVGCGGKEKERKAEEEVEGRCKCGEEKHKLGCVEATIDPHIEMEKDAVEEEVYVKRFALALGGCVSIGCLC